MKEARNIAYTDGMTFWDLQWEIKKRSGEELGSTPIMVKVNGRLRRVVQIKSEPMKSLCKYPQPQHLQIVLMEEGG